MSEIEMSAAELGARLALPYRAASHLLEGLRVAGVACRVQPRLRDGDRITGKRRGRPASIWRFPVKVIVDLQTYPRCS